MIKPGYSVSFPLSINVFVWQTVLYFLDAPRINVNINIIVMFHIIIFITYASPPTFAC